MAGDLKRVVIWKNLSLDGTDYCELSRSTEGWRLKGMVIAVLQDGRPMLANYDVSCDENWLTRRVHVERTIGGEIKALSLSVESGGVWRSAGRELPAIRGCDDIDLAVTPATNTLPIRRLNLEIGGSEPVTAAWVKFPDLNVEPLSQRYTRRARDTYHYESNTGFSADVVVDDFGLVTVYPGGWERIGSL